MKKHGSFAGFIADVITDNVCFHEGQLFFSFS